MFLSEKNNKNKYIYDKKINCKSCLKYKECKLIEDRFRNELEQLDGNWRALFDNGRRVGTPTRRCSHAIVEKHRDKFKGKNVLEIGCGPSSEIDYIFCNQNSVQYTGLDPERLPLYFIPYTVGKRLQNKIFISLFKLLNIRKLPKLNLHQRYIRDYYPTKHLSRGSFDLIYGNSTIEHWHEKVDDTDYSLKLYREDIEQCYNLLKPGGKLLINCPMYVHGNRIFLLGQVNVIKHFFSNKWKSVEFEHWRESYDDLLPHCPKKRKRGFKERYKIDLENIWLLNIIASK